MKSKKGLLCIVIGLLLIVAALSLAFYNIWDSERAEKAALNTVAEIEKVITDNPDNSNNEISLVDYPDMKMPITEVDGYEYIGILEIPEFNLKLPVMQDWDYTKLDISPCCYYGSVYKDDLVIAAHNYYSHFGGLGQLTIGSEIIFTDIYGYKYNYNVIWTEVIQPGSIDQMIEEKIDDPWDLTLFTCTISGGSRFTVRCAKSSDNT